MQIDSNYKVKNIDYNLISTIIKVIKEGEPEEIYNLIDSPSLNINVCRILDKDFQHNCLFFCILRKKPHDWKTPNYIDLNYEIHEK